MIEQDRSGSSCSYKEIPSRYRDSTRKDTDSKDTDNMDTGSMDRDWDWD